MKKAFSLVLVLTLGLAAEVAKADFTFGEPTNLGPAVNSTAGDEGVSLSADGLILLFHSTRPGGYGSLDIWMTTRATKDDPWGEAVNLGPTINSPDMDWCPSISPDGCTLYFGSWRSGGMGMSDIWISTRATIEDDWSEPINLGPTINTSGIDSTSTISSDELMLYFESIRPGGYGSSDIWVSTRQTKDDPWEEAVNLGPPINTKHEEMYPKLSPDGLLLVFSSGLIGSARPGGMGGSNIWMARRNSLNAEWSEPVNLGSPVNSSDSEASPFLSADGRMLYFDVGGGPGKSGDLYQVSIEPVVDLNSDGIVDADDMCIVVDNWGTDNPLCDIGPTPFGDGIVDVEDLIVLADHLFEEVPPVEPVE